MTKGIPSWSSCFQGDNMGAESIITKIKKAINSQKIRTMALPFFTEIVYHNSTTNQMQIKPKCFLNLLSVGELVVALIGLFLEFMLK